MKKIATIIPTLVLTLVVTAQKDFPVLPIDPGSKTITYSEVISVDSADKKELFARASEWFAIVYRSSKAVIELKDKEDGKIIGKAVIPVKMKYLGWHDVGYINYTISVSVKDEKYKYEITNFYHEGRESKYPDFGDCTNWLLPRKGAYGGMISWKTLYGQLLTQMDDNITELIESLKQGMNSKSKSENW